MRGSFLVSGFISKRDFWLGQRGGGLFMGAFFSFFLVVWFG